MRKWIAILLCICLFFSMTACTGQGAEQGAEQRAEQESETDYTTSQEYTDSNILIAYFTWAENTHVDNPDAVDVDATTSASVLLPGNTAKMAGWIQERVGGDLFSIVVTEAYSSDYDECLDRAADEIAENARPELVNHVEHMDDYDVIFLGFPNWWYTAPMAIFSFIEEYDLSGKTIIPFSAHGTSGLASSIKDITEALPDSAKVLEPIGVYRPDVDSAQPTINEWLNGLGFIERTVDEAEPAEQEEATGPDNTVESESDSRQVMITIDGQEYLLTLGDGVTADSLYEMLPLELSFEDFNNIEKISYTPQELTIDESVGGHTPAVGDLCIYVPWGNLSIFYQEFHYSDDLIYLGHIDTGIDVIASMENDFSVILE